MLRQRRPRLILKKITQAARGQDCTLRHPDLCNGNPETTVAAHPNWLAAGKGIGLKTDDLGVAFVCSSCHEYLDRGRDGDRPRFFLFAHLETLRVLYELGVIKV